MLTQTQQDRPSPKHSFQQPSPHQVKSPALLHVSHSKAISNAPGAGKRPTPAQGSPLPAVSGCHSALSSVSGSHFGPDPSAQSSAAPSRPARTCSAALQHRRLAPRPPPSCYCCCGAASCAARRERGRAEGRGGAGGGGAGELWAEAVPDGL